MSETLSDAALIEAVQRRSLRFFWEFAHPVSFMARDRAVSDEDPGNDIVTTGGTGMGAMAIVAGVERGWLDRGEAVARLGTLVRFLLAGDRFHGAVSHFMNGTTGKVIAFSPQDNGGDLVEDGLPDAGAPDRPAIFRPRRRRGGAAGRHRPSLARDRLGVVPRQGPQRAAVALESRSRLGHQP